MLFSPFEAYFPEIAMRETRTVIVRGWSPFKLPAGEYAFPELFCDEPGCDCRRVFFYVVSPTSSSPLAVVAYGWETDAFYAQWAHEDDPQVIHQLKGPVLNLGSPQSRYAPEFLRLIDKALLQDPAYMQRLKAHYDLFRRQVEARETSDMEEPDVNE